jgi:hypothetical protein
MQYRDVSAPEVDGFGLNVLFLYALLHSTMTTALAGNVTLYSKLVLCDALARLRGKMGYSGLGALGAHCVWPPPKLALMDF